MTVEEFGYSGVMVPWEVPAGVAIVEYEVVGGGDALSEVPGFPQVGGGRQTGRLSTTPGETLYLYVGSRSSGVFDGGDSGSGFTLGSGSSQIRAGTDDLAGQVVVAGGAGRSVQYTGAFGLAVAAGGYGGGAGAGGDGADGSHAGYTAGGGSGATTGAGGAAGADGGAGPGVAHPAEDGTRGQGGAGAYHEDVNENTGGGGGGGYYGGGGGGQSIGTPGGTPNIHGGGGGGSGYADPSRTSDVVGYDDDNIDNGRIVFTYGPGWGLGRIVW